MWGSPHDEEPSLTDLARGYRHRRNSGLLMTRYGISARKSIVSDDSASNHLYGAGEVLVRTVEIADISPRRLTGHSDNRDSCLLHNDCFPFHFIAASSCHFSHLQLTMDPPARGQPTPIKDSRDQLRNRSIPHMVLRKGDEHSINPSPKAINKSVPSKSASDRFAVVGNAIVTGGTGTLGLAACNALLEHGLTGLAIFDIDAAQSEDELVSIKARFPSCKIMVIQVDVIDETAVFAAVDRAEKLLGSINHLLCFSGIVGCVDAISMPAAQWRRILDVNTNGAFFCAQAVARKMAKRETGGSIIFTASISAHRVNYPQPQAAYNVSKAALVTLKNCLAAEWARYGIRTNSISPGYMDTILNEGYGIADARDIWADRNPSGRMGLPSELTGAVVLLSSAAGSYINGSDIVVDGGSVVF